jgi:indolepyruvate ferredoxin oxidoreductase beta subunit
MDNKTFNIILTGVGGQGIITLLQVLDEAAFIEGYQVKSSELHGLSQRGGSVEAHVRFGINKEVFSPMVSNGQVDLILSLEILEGLREAIKANKQTKLLVNEYFLPFLNTPSKEEITNQLKSLKNELHLVPASQICKDKLQSEVVCTIYLLGYASNKGLLPIQKQSLLQAVKNVIPEKYRELNINALNLGYVD